MPDFHAREDLTTQELREGIALSLRASEFLSETVNTSKMLQQSLGIMTNGMITSVQYLLLQTMLIQFKAAPKQIELQNRAWSHPKAIEKIFQMRLSSYL